MTNILHVFQRHVALQEDLLLLSTTQRQGDAAGSRRLSLTQQILVPQATKGSHVPISDAEEVPWPSEQAASSDCILPALALIHKVGKKKKPNKPLSSCLLIVKINSF